MLILLIEIILGFTVFLSGLHFFMLNKQQHLRDHQLKLSAQIESIQQQLTTVLPLMDSHLRQQTESLHQTTTHLREHLEKQLHQSHIENLQHLQNRLEKGLSHLQQNILDTLKTHLDANHRELNKLTVTTENQLKTISGQVEKRLSEGFEKTNATFVDIMQRLAIIDGAQKKITELSSNVISLQNILSDKQARGIFGEVQLTGLIRNVMPENSFALQHTLSNGKRADCILFLPSPTGHVVIDSKFPLENFRRLMATQAEENKSTITALKQQFSQDIKKHIQDIAVKYIIENETACGAVMFIPAEAIFSEIHAYYPELVEYAQKNNVWMASPTTMMAILTTARAVLKDAATRQQVHIIQQHLGALSKDFSRFQERMDDLSNHIRKANDDVSKIHTSAKKISTRFQQIERVELEESNELLAEKEEIV